MRISDWSSDVCSSDLQIYSKAKPDYTGRVTVPVLWDRLRGTIVSNESANIIRMFNRSEEHTSELQSLMRISYAVFCLKKKNTKYVEYLLTTSSHQCTI